MDIRRFTVTTDRIWKINRTCDGNCYGGVRSIFRLNHHWQMLYWLLVVLWTWGMTMIARLLNNLEAVEALLQVLQQELDPLPVAHSSQHPYHHQSQLFQLKYNIAIYFILSHRLTLIVLIFWYWGGIKPIAWVHLLVFNKWNLLTRMISS